jgi:nucleotide-binding universal stress UspA family protein
MIVVGVDGSDGGQRALEWAVARSVDIGATLIAVHVLRYTKELLRDLPPTGITRWRRDLEAQLNRLWVTPARDVGVAVKTLLVENDTAAAGLATTADREGADLIVVGCHGEGNLADRILGSTSYKLTHRATQPVVVVPSHWRAHAA